MVVAASGENWLMRRALPAQLWLPVLLMVVVCACGRSAASQTEGETPAEVPAVEVVQAREGKLPLVERLTGTARASGEVAIFPEASGRIAEVLVQNGAAVSRGQPLVRIQAAGAAPQLDQARSQLAVAEAEVRESQAALADLRRQLERTTTLAERGLVSRQEVDTQSSQVEAARATVARTQAQVAAARALVAERAAAERQTVVRAPISGRVGQRNAEVGMLVDQQTQLFLIGELSRMRVEVPVSQDVLAHLRVGHRALVTTTADEAPIDARVSRISPFLTPGAFSGQVEIDVPNQGRLVPGMFVTVDVHYGESELVTLVPSSAIYEDPTTGEAGVFIVPAAPDELKASQGTLTTDPVGVPFRAVDVLASGRQTVGVGGVRPGEWVVVVGQHLLAASATSEARVRAVEWDHIVSLQEIQREDLLRQFMDKQQRAQPDAASR
jgi:RND family efflux transporter MFP subunit